MANKRLIDANALKSQITRYHTSLTPRYISKLVDAEIGDIIDIIDEAPTVDAVEVVHAHWEDGCAIHNGKEVYKSIDCSHCEEVFKIESETREYWKARFKVCPFCGAVMDGGNEDA